MYNTPLLSVFPKQSLPQVTSLVDYHFVSSVFTPVHKPVLPQEMFPVDHQVRYIIYRSAAITH